MAVAIILFVIVIMLFGASQTSIGSAMLPEGVSDAVRRLLPRSLISDANVSGLGEFEVTVNQAGAKIPVHVRQHDGMTFAWIDNAEEAVPNYGTYLFSGWHHNICPDSPVDAGKLKSRVDGALREAMATCGFTRAGAEVSTIEISVFVADEDVVSLDTVTEAFNEPDGRQWATALQEAVQHDDVGQNLTFARGSLLLDIRRTDSDAWLRRAVAVADIVLDVSPAEKERRMRVAITGLFQKFAPKKKSDPVFPKCDPSGTDCSHLYDSEHL